MSASTPTPAERARTVLAGASMATLVAPSCPGSRTMTLVHAEVGADGHPVLWLQESSPLVRVLGNGKVVSLLFPAFAPFRSLQLTGPLRQRPRDRAGHRGYRVSPVGVRLVGSRSLSIPLSEFAAAEPDPLRDQADAVLRHLEQAHAGELLACVQAHGFADVVAVVPRELDRYGITLGALCRDGVRSLRLPFPGGPVDRLEDVALGLRVPLTCRCRSGSA